MDNIDDIIPTELSLLIAEQDNHAFISMRLISRSILNYTNDELIVDQLTHRYKEKFSVLIEKFNYVHKEMYWKLPNGMVHGRYQSYYLNGKLCFDFGCKDGKKEGQFRSYYENGQLSGECRYKAGKIDGTYRSYYENGQLHMERRYKNGKKIREFYSKLEY